MCNVFTLNIQGQLFKDTGHTANEKEAIKGSCIPINTDSRGNVQVSARYKTSAQGKASVAGKPLQV